MHSGPAETKSLDEDIGILASIATAFINSTYSKYYRRGSRSC